MAIELTSLDELDPAIVADVTDKLAQYMQERHPEVDLKRGVFHDLVLYFNAALNAAIQENIDRLRRSASLRSVIAEPTLADEEVVDNLLSNYNTLRDVGSAATGSITAVLSLPELSILPAGGTLTAGTVTYIIDNAINILPPGAVATQENERVMVEVGDGSYVASFPVRATTTGAAGNISRGTILTNNFVAGNVTQFYAASDFSGGQNAATNQDYVSKLKTNLAAKTIGGRQSYAATIREQPLFNSVKAVSVVGAADPEQHRDQHTLFPVSGGGKTDVYVQTTPYAVATRQLLDAVFIETGPDGGVWQLNIDAATAPAFYDVISVTPPTDINNNGYKISMDVRGVDLTAASFQPDIRYVYEGVYSRYQTAVVRFIDNEKPTTGLTPLVSRAQYAVTTRALPLIDSISDFLTGRDVRARGSDILVKAPIPCFTRIALDVLTEANAPLSNEQISAIQAAVSETVAAVGFSGQLNASLIDKTVHTFLSGRQAIGRCDLFGQIRRPDGQLVYLRDTHRLLIPDDPARLVTGNTTVFLTAPEDVTISSVAGGFTG